MNEKPRRSPPRLSIYKFKPSLTDVTIDFLRDLYSNASVVLEYGTGASTFLALESSQESAVFGCETDSAWLASLSMEVSLKGMGGRFYPIYQNIGSTEKWGRPCFNSEPFSSVRGGLLLKAPRMPWLALKSMGISPDVILIDGRFRVASFLACFLNTTKPATLVFDDYVNRPQYHVVEKLITPESVVDDRAAVFRLNPLTEKLDANLFLEIFGANLMSFE